MISAGTNLLSKGDQLKKVTIKYLVDTIRNPRPEMMAMIRQLRIVRQLNPSQYNNLKCRLPYFVCALFTPPFRKTEYFAYTEYFVLDIDHLEDFAGTMIDLRKSLASDSRVLMCFTSPGGNGLKVMMKLKERCYDPSVYKIFYKLFADNFSRCYHLGNTIDQKTCDVTRACFISVDHDIYFNPDAECIDLKAVIDIEENVSRALDLKHDIEQDLACTGHTPLVIQSTDPDKETMNLIRQRLNQKAKSQRKSPSPYVPRELESIMESLKSYIESTGARVTEIINIQYGKKLRISLELRKAELNIFYGKKGFSVVQSPRTGTDAEMNALMADVVESFIFEHT